MKNNCDVTANQSLSAECKGNGPECEYFEMYDGACGLEYNGACLCLAAIRAAIEAEHIVDANKMMARDCENCKHADGPAMKGPCKDCVVMRNWEPADAGEKGE